MSNKTEIMLGPSASKEGIHMIARYEDDKVEILLIESDKARFLSIPTIEQYTSRISELEAKVKELRDTNRDMIESYIDSVKELNGRIAELETENKLLRGALIDAKQDAAALVDQDRWIPVTERLPEEESKWYLCYNPHFEIHPIITSYANGIWYEEGFDITKYVTHWQPLPQPPKEQ